MSLVHSRDSMLYCKPAQKPRTGEEPIVIVLLNDPVVSLLNIYVYSRRLALLPTLVREVLIVGCRG